MKTTAALSLLALPAAMADNWAVLIAGSNTYGNYRHQADVLHAAQIVKSHGIPESNIIVMAYDDIATSSENPFPGQVFNKPTSEGTAGYDVYDGVSITYSGEDVTAENFLAVLKGDSATTGGKPVLQSTADDNVFVFFSDHGASGLVAMPTGSYLYAQDLNDALQSMHDNNQYKELVFYLEACESGSMFENILPEGISVYATTASNSQEPSWGTYCGTDAMVDGKDVGSCLGDLYAVSWMEDSDIAVNFARESLDDQLATVTTLTNLSHVMGFGDTSMGDEKIADFQGLKSEGRGLRKPTKSLPEGALEEHSRDNVVDSRDNQLHYLMHKYLTTGCPVVAEELKAEIDAREEADARFAAIGAAVAGEDFELLALPKLSEFDCHREVHEAVREHCGGYSDYSLKYARGLVNLCEAGHDAETIVAAVHAACY